MTGGDASLRAEVDRSLGSAVRRGDTVTALLTFAADLAVFEGHFPGSPLVPGVYLLDAVRAALERADGTPLRLVEAAEVKFTAPVLPGDRVELLATTTRDGGYQACRAVLSLGTAIAASANLVFESAEVDAEHVL